ncbi:hypothetical protein [Paraburkholderia sp.]|uniref:hypothetical protein n=1 Tax=Paraburkholderia sp. TaxID=1926495 RepID=UPI00286F3AA5|nr:hypothetical protein [Paraburkholderia sp.]
MSLDARTSLVILIEMRVQRLAENGGIVGYDFAEKDLAHIQNILGHLEHTAGNDRAAAVGAVISLEYWRARVRTLLALPLLPIHIEKQAKALLARLDRLENSRRCAARA